MKLAKRWKCTDVDLVTLERSPIELVVVELDDSPVPGVLVGLSGDCNGLDVDNLADDALAQNGPVLRDFRVELVCLLDLLLCLLYQTQ